MRSQFVILILVSILIFSSSFPLENISADIVTIPVKNGPYGSCINSNTNRVYIYGIADN